MAPSSGGSGLDLFISNIARWLSSLPCSAGGDTFGIAALSNQLAHGCGTSPFPVSDQSEPDIVHVGNNVDDPKSPSFAMGSKADGDAQSCSFDGRCGEPQPMEDDLNEVQMTRDAGQNLEHYKLDDGSYNQVRVASFDQIAARGCFSGNWFPLRAYQDQSRFCVGKRWVECTKCFLWRDNHLDYLAPVRDSYPPQCLHYREKPQRCFLVGGGRSETTGAHELLQGLGLKEMIRELVIAEVRAAIKEAFAGLGGTESLVAAAFNQAPKLEGRGKGAGNAVPNAAPANTVVGNRDSTDDANLNSKFEDKSQPRSKGNRKGNHEGATSQFVSHDADLGKWITVRPHKANADVEVQLRQQDWDDPLINYSSLASKLEECSSQPFRAVVHCQPQNIETAKMLLKGSGKTHSVLLIEFAKDRKTKGKGKDTDDKTNLRQRLPVKAGNFVKFVDGFVHQVFSDGVQVSKPKGLTVTTKLTPKKTSVLFCKIPKEFVSSEEWQKFKDNPRIEIAKWASKLQVQCVDAFNWSEERLPQGRQQIFGAIRVAEKDGPTLLAGSGTSAVFVQAPKAESTEQYVQWVERNKGEPNHAYLARVMRAKGALGLAFRGQSLGSRHHADANTPITRIWILEGTPREVDMEQAKTVLQPVFNDVTIIRQINRGSTRSFVFRAACARGNEVDLIPIVVELSQGPITAWAKVAPPRDDKVKQRPIKGGSLPCIDHKSSLDPVSVIVELPCDKGNEASAQDDQSTEDKPQAQAKETSAPKRQKALVRQPPPGTKLIPQEKDGNCLYHTVVAALNSERKDKTFHHTELRARVVAHMKAHPEWYKADWESDGKKGPDGNPCKDWDCFLEQVAKPGSYSCDLELRALCRLCQFKAVLVPEDPNFSVVAYGKKWKSKTHCIFYSHRHFDYLSPDGDDKYPDELLNVQPKMAYAWQCKFCDQGILNSVRTMNINRKGEQLIKATRDFMLQSNIQILAMQEVDVGTRRIDYALSSRGIAAKEHWDDKTFQGHLNMDQLDEDFEQQEQNIAIAMWRARVRNNSNAQIAWVKPSAPHVSLTFDAESLRAANKAMFGKAPGPDSWMPEHLHRLPDNFWSAAAMLWAKALALGRLPKRWTEATVSLIPKKIDEARPICLANILWRCGARVLAHRLRPWLTSFIDERSFGGAPGRSVIDAHLKVLQAVHDGVSEFIFEDLSAFFDSLTMPVLRPILQHLRAPQQLVNILQAFYVAPMRLFRYKGVVRPTWHQATAGIMQGCPLSPMLALCVGHIWAQFSASAKIETLCFVDDRLLWMKPGVASFQQSVSQALDNALSDADGNPVILATDGSSKHSVSAFACVIQAYPAPARIAAAHGAEDQTSFQAECFALHAVATAVSCVASRGRRGQIMILCDCRAAIQHAVAVPESLALPLLAASLQSSLSHASQQGLYCELHWVPSHGKMSSWKAPPGLDDVVCRELNAIADREAGILMERRRLESARSQWFRSVEDARQWATTAIRISAEASAQYRRFFSAA
ncbi:Pol [Symbiodinium microadriaticum]|nr:Pol [Symbiodinium microadriaticum]